MDTRGARLAVIMLTTMCVLLLGAPTHATDECVTCHTNLEKLKEIVSGLPQDPRKDSVSPAWIEGLKPLTRAEKVLVKAVYLDKEEFLANDDHGDISCGECHGGDPEATDFEAAHKDLVTDPSYPAPGICMDCHDYDQYENTVHYKGGAKGEKCTATCGNCHISRPAHIGGGLVNGHLFDTVPTMNATCNTCHSGIAVGEYTGRIQGLQPDVHFQESEMHCAECHTGDEVHISSAEHTPNCLACHEDVYGKNAEFKEVHSLHRGRLSCQVCHAQGYAVQEPCSGEADPKAHARHLQNRTEPQALGEKAGKIRHPGPGHQRRGPNRLVPDFPAQHPAPDRTGREMQ